MREARFESIARPSAVPPSAVVPVAIPVDDLVASLRATLRTLGPTAVAVSGGVDSMTLAAFAHRTLADVEMIHASSAAVPAEATARVRALAAREGWRLAVVDAGEFADPRYRANPVNRCFFCKTNLYGSIRALTDRQVVSGANLDDLGEYRPGLDAAREHAVRHPYVEAGIDKRGVRAIAAWLGLGAIAELPSSPCLSSRVETGIPIEPATLAMIHAVERLVSQRIAPRTVRCRVRASGIVVELDRETLNRIAGDEADALIRELRGLPDQPADVRFEPYRTGSAFLVVNT
jgi:uncharacterized protein